MKISALLSFCIFLFPVSHFAIAQKLPRIGSVTRNEIEMKQYLSDTSAAAVYLYDGGNSRVEPTFAVGTLFHRYFKIKILKKKGLSFANVKIVAAHGSFSQLKGATWTIESGAVHRSVLKSNMIFVTRLNSKTDEITVFFPNVSVGAVIECSYSISREKLFLFGWDFQYDIPALFSEYTMISPVWGQEVHLQGVLPFTKEETLSHETKRVWQMKNVPAFREEPVMPGPSVFHSRILFTTARETWEEVYIKLRKDPYFGEVINSSYLKDTVTALVANVQDTLEKVKVVSAWIKKQVTWKNISDFRSSELRNLLKRHRGTSGDINLMLIVMLRHAGLTAEPVLLSTRENGFISDEIPSLDFFNYVVCQVTVGGISFLTDATEKFLPIDLLPPRCLNYKGFLVGEKSYGWIPIEAPAATLSASSASMTVSPGGVLHGNILVTESGYAAFKTRKAIDSMGNDDYKKQMAASNGWIIHSASEFSDDAKGTYKTNYEVTVENAATDTNNELIINPFFQLNNFLNPFAASKRNFPVDFAYPADRQIECILTLPEGYTIDHLPASARFALPENAARCSFKITQSENQVKVNVHISLVKTLFDPPEYPDLREFYSRIGEKIREVIVAVKR